MKRYVRATTHKKSSLDETVTSINNFLTQEEESRYLAKANYSENCVDIIEKSSYVLVSQILLKYEKDNVKRGKFRRATQDEIERGVPMYVREVYETEVYKQVPIIDKIKSIARVLNN